MVTVDKALEDRCVNTLRFLAVDAIEKANSGHPGMPLGAAAMAFVVWHDFLRFDPTDPGWIGRDRFVLSSGHASALLYALLHCAGAGLSLDELKAFRQWGSRTPGHPERGLTPGVESTTGPLGQGFAMGVGMALGARLLAARLGAAGEELSGHRVFGLVSDGDMMEGITHEAASLAGHLRLGNLVYLYDSNGISIEGPLSLAMSEDVGQRFRGYGWAVQEIDGLDTAQVRAALSKAAAPGGSDRPSLIIGRTRIGYGSTKEGKAECHGSPLGKASVEALRERFGWPRDVTFHVPPEVREVWAAWGRRNGERRAEWTRSLEAWQARDPDLAATWRGLVGGEGVPADLLGELAAAVAGEKGATRSLSGRVIQRAAAVVPALIGGSADLAPSNNTQVKGAASVAPGSFAGRNLHFGIREHAMAAVCNGLALHGPWRPYCGTFLAFTDYMRPAMRLSALMGVPVTYVMTHDSIFLGEDGPTHQAVEHLWALRMIPRLRVLRPADGVEVAAAWAMALESRGTPHVLALSRQALPAIARPEGFDPASIRRGAYVVAPEAGPAGPAVTIVATGSEVWLAIAARELLARDGVDARVVSMPCVELFEAEDAGYRAGVVPPGVPAVAVEAGVTGPWRGVLGPAALAIGLDDFGASAPSEVLAEQLGFTPDQVARKIAAWLRSLA